MEYIIIFRSNHRDPHVLTDNHDFKATFSTHEQAKEHADKCLDGEYFFDYEIFQTAEP